MAGVTVLGVGGYLVLTSDTDVFAAAAAGEITLTDTEEFYGCSVVGPK